MIALLKLFELLTIMSVPVAEDYPMLATRALDMHSAKYCASNCNTIEKIYSIPVQNPVQFHSR